MILFLFPRLDRPTVVGEEGRPRTVSLGVASLVVLALSALGGYLLGDPGLVTTVGVVSGSLVSGLALLERDRFGTLIVGTFLTIPVSTVLVWWVAGETLSTSRGVVLAGMAVALFGIGLTWIDLDGKADVEDMINRVAVAYGGSVLGGFVPLVLYGIFLIVVGLGGSGGNGFTSAYSLPLSVTVLCGTVFVAAGALPFAQLAPRPRRQAVAERVSRAKRLAGVGAAVSFCGAIGLAFLGPTDGIYRFVRALSSPLVVWSVVLLSGLLLGVAGIAALAKRVTRDRDASAQQRVAAMVAGALVGVLLLVFPLPVSLLALAILLLLVGPIVFIVAAVLLGVVMGVGLVPERFGGLSLASAGLALLTVGAALVPMPAPFVFAAGAGTIVVWDVSAYGAGVTAELGHLPQTRRLELVHAVVALFVGTLAVGAASALYALRTSTGLGLTVQSAMAVALIGALVALLPLRG